MAAAVTATRNTMSKQKMLQTSKIAVRTIIIEFTSLKDVDGNVIIHKCEKSHCHHYGCHHHHHGN